MIDFTLSRSQQQMHSEAAGFADQVLKGAALTIAATGLGLTPLILSGNETFQKEHLKPLLSGEGEPLASLMHSEPGVTANWLERDGKG